MLDDTSQEMSAPLISLRANTASLKPILQKSNGKSSLIDDFSSTEFEKL